MDGAQAWYRYFGGSPLRVRVSRRVCCAEASLKGGVERQAMRILVIVGSDFFENKKRRKSKVSLAIFVSQGLVGS